MPVLQPCGLAVATYLNEVADQFITIPRRIQRCLSDLICPCTLINRTRRLIDVRLGLLDKAITLGREVRALGFEAFGSSDCVFYVRDRAASNREPLGNSRKEFRIIFRALTL